MFHEAETVQEIISDTEKEFLLCVCVHLGVAALLLMSANWSEHTKNSIFLEPLDIEWEDECVSDTFLSL